MKSALPILLLAPFFSLAQSTAILQVADEISMSDLKANVYKLAAPEMEGRQAGTRGDSVASVLIADWFKKQGLAAPYERGTSFFQSVPLQKIMLTRAEISSAGKKYREFDDWYIFLGNTCKTVKFDSLPVVFAGYGIVSDQYNNLAGVDVRGKAVIILQVQPADELPKLLSSSTKSSISADYMKNLAERGAAAVLVSSVDFDKSTRALKNTAALRSYRNQAANLNPLPRIYASDKMINDLLLPNDVTIQSLIINLRRTQRPLAFDTKASIGLNLQVDSVMQQATNVIGLIKGTDTAAAAVVVSAHHDHLGKIGSQVFAGAADNATGTAALMEIAKLVQKAAKKGMLQKRSIVFASFTGEELGLLGSFHYTQYPLYKADKTWAGFNLEMLGTADSFHSGITADSNYSYYSIIDSLGHGLENSLFDANNTLPLKLDDRYQKPENANRWLSASDTYPFYLRGVPIIQTGAGYPKTYHQFTDTPDKIRFSLLTLQTKLAFLTLWNIANN